MALPVVLIHQGNSDYLPYTLAQLASWMPESPVWFLGTWHTRHLQNRQVRHRDLSRHQQAASEFAKIYKHFSTNGYDYELFCIQRWYVLAEFMQAEGLDQVLYLDSDLLVYDNLAERAFLHPKGLTRLGKSPHTCFVASLESLQLFLGFVTRCYSGPLSDAVLGHFLAEHTAQNGNVGGISDMTLFQKFAEEYPSRAEDIALPQAGSTLYDIRIDYHQGLLMQDGLKRITWHQFQPWGTTQAEGQAVRMLTLHFQGASKRHIARYVSPPAQGLVFALRYNQIMLLIQKVLRKLKVAA